MRILCILALLFLSLQNQSLFAQNQILEPCGTRISSEAENWFHSLDHSFRKNLRLQAGELFIPVVIHIVGNDNGNGYFPKEQAFQLICELNRQYIPASIRFFLADTFYYINNSRYYNHDWSAGYEMMDVHNVFNAMNVYIVQNPSDACGYAYYPGGGPGNGRGGIALAKACSRPGNSTLPHEVGHYLSLPHTFDNWNSSGASEFVNGSNCASAGDYFCDTPADFLDFRWNCPYTGSKLDLNGDPYQPDGSFFMSYSIEPCGKRFSQEQMDAMRISRTQDRPYLNSIPAPTFYPEQITTLLTPSDSAIVPTAGFMLRWNAVPGATEYVGMITPINSFTFSTVKFFTTDTFFHVAQGLENDKSYHWKVSPISPYYPCVDPDSMGTSFQFRTDGTLTATSESLESELFQIQPVPSLSTEPILLTFPASSGISTIRVLDLSGRSILNWVTQSTQSSHSIPAYSLPAGCYWVQFQSETKAPVTKRILIY